jgi:hypothetical protein
MLMPLLLHQASAAAAPAAALFPAMMQLKVEAQTGRAY